MDDRKIAFIICVNNMQYYEECVRYIQELDVPEGYCTDILCIQEADSMTQGYNGGMQASDAKYKVYLHQDTFILNRSFINDIVKIFCEDESIGMIGVLGANKLPSDANCYLSWNIGNIEAYNGKAAIDTDFFVQSREQKWSAVEAIDGLIMVTQYDIPWREDVFDGWDFYDVSQSLEMKRHGYKVVIPYQETPWCYHDCGCSKLKKYDYYRERAIREYPETFLGNVDLQEVVRKTSYQEELEAVAKELIELFISHQFAKLNEIAQKMREKWFLNTDIREVMNLMEMYTLESASVSGIHSEWFEMRDWNQILEYYRWVRFVVLRIEYEREDERAAQLKELVKAGRISRDAIRKVSAVSMKDSWKVYPYLLREDREEPLVSVVVPTYNGEAVLGAALDSILGQTYRNLEVIVVDDASTDSTREKILAYRDSRIKSIFLEKNHHICYAGNVGFENASGKYVALIGHDDQWRMDKIEKQIAFLEEHPNYNLCVTWTNIIDEHGIDRNKENYDSYTKFNADNLGADQWCRSIMLNGNSFCAPSACIRSEVLKKAGYYRYALVQLQDYDLWLRMLQEGEAYVLQERLTYYRRFNETGKNISELNIKTRTRDAHEKQWIHNFYIKNMSSERYIRIFGEDLKNSNASSEKEILCEKAFFLWEHGNCYAEDWFIQLFEDEECRAILELEYQFEMKDFYKMNQEPMLFDGAIVEMLQAKQQIISGYEEKMAELGASTCKS